MLVEVELELGPFEARVRPDRQRVAEPGRVDFGELAGQDEDVLMATEELRVEGEFRCRRTWLSGSFFSCSSPKAAPSSDGSKFHASSSKMNWLS